MEVCFQVEGHCFHSTTEKVDATQEDFAILKSPMRPLVEAHHGKSAEVGTDLGVRRIRHPLSFPRRHSISIGAAVVSMLVYVRVFPRMVTPKLGGFA